MPFSLLPCHTTDALTDLTPQWVSGQGIRLLLLDFDNTVIPYTTDTVPPETEAWFQRMLDAGVQLCVVSNSHKSRAAAFCEKWGIPCITHANKPGTRGIRAALDRLGMPAQQAAMVGDQIFTDTLGGNRAGVTTILVRSINNHNFWLKARHVLEKPFIYLARKRRIDYEKP